ncbi:2-dehydropantoate 2-reductase [Minicystis rosea]|nr:2-dehydropantoate 2-reductase [Minicystis rosea]
MRICIFGAGAIGGHLGVKLTQAGADVTFIARGAHLEAMKEHGVRWIENGTTVTVRPRCVGSVAEAGPQDYVIVTLKAPSLPGAAPEIARLLGPETAVVAAVNGVPWWYFHALSGPHAGRIVESVDPGGIVSRHLPPERVIGCVVYPAAEVVAPGVIEHRYGERYTLGEPDGTKSARATALSEALTKAGLKAPVRPRIRDELWVKLWGNMAFNPVSLLTGATLDRIVGEEPTRVLCRAMMLEGQAIAEALGVRFPIGVDRRIAGAAEVGVHKTSMLQDLERGRPVEIDALLGAVVELAGVVGVEAPMSRAILALARQRATVAGCYGA